MYVPNEDLAQIARQPLMLMSYANPLAKCNVVDELGENAVEDRYTSAKKF